jgi:hypothetical protein
MAAPARITVNNFFPKGIVKFTLYEKGDGKYALYI